MKPNTSTPKTSRLSHQAVQEFQQLYFEEYKIKLSSEEAETKAFKFLTLFKQVYFPIKKKSI